MMRNKFAGVPLQISRNEAERNRMMFERMVQREAAAMKEKGVR